MKTLKAFALSLITLASASIAKADGFKCMTAEGYLAVKVYNHTEPSMGTRSVSTMIISDPSVGFGRKTVALFTSEKGTLAAHGLGKYVAAVDLRMKASRRAGEYLVGTRLGELDTISLDLDFNYAYPVEDGAEVLGLATFVKRNGEVLSRELVCSRYLKAD